MFERVKFRWRVQLQAEDGEVVIREVHAYWSPKFEGISETVAGAARAIAHVKDSRRREFAPISVELIA